MYSMRCHPQAIYVPSNFGVYGRCYLAEGDFCFAHWDSQENALWQTRRNVELGIDYSWLEKFAG